MQRRSSFTSRVSLALLTALLLVAGPAAADWVDLGGGEPVTFVIIALILFALFRHPAHVALPLTSVTLSLIWTFGLMAMIQTQLLESCILFGSQSIQKALDHVEDVRRQRTQEQLEVARKILSRAGDHGIPAADVLIDPLVLPVGATPMAGRIALETLRLVRAELGVNTVCGASNISFGLPDRPAVNSAFLSMSVAAGITAVIANPLDEASRTGILTGDLLMGNDEHCMNWITAHRKSNSEA